MGWVLVAMGIFALIGVAMYAPEWWRWRKWRKRLPERRARRLRASPAVGAPIWYGGSSGGAPGAGSDCATDGGAFDGGGCD